MLTSLNLKMGDKTGKQSNQAIENGKVKLEKFRASLQTGKLAPFNTELICCGLCRCDAGLTPHGFLSILTPVMWQTTIFNNMIQYGNFYLFMPVVHQGLC